MPSVDVPTAGVGELDAPLATQYDPFHSIDKVDIPIPMFVHVVAVHVVPFVEYFILTPSPPTKIRESLNAIQLHGLTGAPTPVQFIPFVEYAIEFPALLVEPDTYHRPSLGIHFTSMFLGPGPGLDITVLPCPVHVYPSEDVAIVLPPDPTTTQSDPFQAPANAPETTALPCPIHVIPSSSDLAIEFAPVAANASQ
jgi:hypothetical protein